MRRTISVIAFVTALLCSSASFAQCVTPLTIQSFGGSGDGIVDNTPAVNDFLAQAPNTNCTTLLLPSNGHYRFATQPNSITQQGISIVGGGKSGTVVLRDYVGDNTTGLFNVRGAPGFQIKGMTINAISGNTGSGIFIRAVGGGVSGALIEDIGIACNGGHWRYPLWVMGDDNTEGAIGARDVTMRGINIFGGYVLDGGVNVGAAIRVTGFVDLNIHGGMTSANCGSVTDGGKIILGDAGTSFVSTYANIAMSMMSGVLSVTNASKIIATSPSLTNGLLWVP